MSLGNVDDVFCDSSRSVDRLRHHYLAMPATPSSLSAASSPGARTERLPSLTDLFHRDILSPPSSGLLSNSMIRSEEAGEAMRRTSSTSSTSSGRSRQWNAPFSNECRPGSIGPPATPLSPFFTVPSKGALVSPTATSPDRSCSAYPGFSDGDRTPRAASRPSFDFTVQCSSGGSSPRCPGAPLIGVQSRGHFETQTWQNHGGGASLGSFESLQRRGSHNSGTSVHLPAETLAKERELMSRLEAEMPKVAGLNGLGVYMDEANVQSPFRKAASATAGRLSQSTSPDGHHTAPGEHTGLTPMVKASKVSDPSSTPTRSKAKRSPAALKTLSPQPAALTQAKRSPSVTAAKKRHEPIKTPLTKSRPMFRLDTGSGKKASKPKGHKMSPDASPWGVFGAKDGWKPLAPPNVSRAIAEANKLVSETTTAASADQSVLKTSPSSKRQAHKASEAASPSKRFRASESHIQSSPFKENMVPSMHSVSPSKRAQLTARSYGSSATALPLSTIR